MSHYVRICRTGKLWWIGFNRNKQKYVIKSYEHQNTENSQKKHIRSQYQSPTSVFSTSIEFNSIGLKDLHNIFGIDINESDLHQINLLYGEICLIIWIDNDNFETNLVSSINILNIFFPSVIGDTIIVLFVWLFRMHWLISYCNLCRTFNNDECSKNIFYLFSLTQRRSQSLFKQPIHLVENILSLIY